MFSFAPSHCSPEALPFLFFFFFFFYILNIYLFGGYLKLLCPSFSSPLAAAMFISALNSKPKGEGPEKHRFESFPHFPQNEDLVLFLNHS